MIRLFLWPRAAVCLLLFSSLWAGCATTAPRTMGVPGGMAPILSPSMMSQPGSIQSAFSEHFLPVENLFMTSKMTIEGRLFGSRDIDILMRTTRGGVARILAQNPSTHSLIFDLVADHERLGVYVPAAQSFHQSEQVAPKTAFSDYYAIEPLDFPDIMLIGQAIAGGSFYAVEGPQTVILIPSTDEENETLVRVELDLNTGLPERAVWAKGEFLRWRVEYLAWDRFANAMTGEDATLLPTHFIIYNDLAKVKSVELQAWPSVPQYAVGVEFDDEAFSLYLPPSGIEMLPMSELGKALRK